MYYTKVVQSLVDKFGYTFIDSINIIEYDYNWAELYQRFSKIKKPVWLANEKILVQHSDTEFFFNGTGLSIYNFNQIIKALDIDPAVFVILTNHKNSTAEWQKYCNHKNNQFHVVESPLTTLLADSKPLKSLGTECQKHFGTMLGLMRGHRVLLAKFLIANQLIDQSIVSINLRSVADKQGRPAVHNCNPGLPTVITTDPNSRNNENWNYSTELTNLYNQIAVVPNINSNQISSYNSTHWLECPWYQDIFVDLVTETVFDYPYPFVSEKVVRPLALGRPLLLFGAAGTLAWLHELGFQTFSNYWDESYDNILDPNDRFIAVCKIIKSINQCSVRDCQSLLDSMQNILKHNQLHYQNWIANGLY